MLPKIRWWSLRNKIIAWSFVPTAIILAAVALATLGAYQRVTQELVIERNRKLTSLLASQLSREGEYIDFLSLLARNVNFYTSNPQAQQVILGQINDIVKPRIGESGQAYMIDSNGRVIYHSTPIHLGSDFSSQPVVQQMLDKQSGTLRNCDPGAIRTRNAEGQETISSYAVIPSNSAGLVVEESWEELIRSSERDRQFLLLLLALGIIFPSLVVTVGVRRVTQPIAELINATQQVAGGNFGRRINTKTNDELEDLAEQFNLMSSQLQESYTHLEKRVADRTKELETVNAIGLTISSTLDPDAVLRTIHDHVSDLMGVPDFFCIISCHNDSQKVFFKVALEQGKTVQELQNRTFDKNGLVGWVIDSGQALVINDLCQERKNLPVTTMIVDQIKAKCQGNWVGIPLKLQDRVTGVILVQSFQPNIFNQHHIQMLSAIANQAAVAIENARLYEQAQQLAVMEERNRLARDLHDSVTQSLYGVTLYAEAAARLLSTGQIELAAEHLRELRHTSQDALCEMRLLIFELRPPLLQANGLVAAIEARLEAVEGRSGLKTELSVNLPTPLPTKVEDGLYRIAQEALNNTLKHAQASKISVSLHQDEHKTTLQVTDNGIGFAPNLVQEQGGLGLRGMQERAIQLGSSLVINSYPQKGTSIKVTIAIHKEEQA